jgi:hypothetical protein
MTRTYTTQGEESLSGYISIFVGHGFTGCGKSQFGLKLAAFRVVQNHHPPQISRPEPTVRDLF